VTHPCDLAQPAGCESLSAAAADAFGRVDVLVHLASIYRAVPLEALTEADWEDDLGANLRSVSYCITAAVPFMRRGGGGRIVAFSDWLAPSGRPRYRGFISYYVAKAGVSALTRALAPTLARDRILVNAIAPGPILPPPDLSSRDVEAVAEATPLNRWGGAAEVGRTVLALVETDVLTGEVVRVDGGRHLR
jgi:NAD(P)-dependent dehydrogenase (short-subunit alcohol dehydrogenase family)